jgi:hypothetical protein
MTSPQPFQLQPFNAPATPQAATPLPASPLSVAGTIARQGERLHLHYVLDDPTGRLRLAAPAPQPSRRDGLWHTTCLELFLAPVGGEAYWEVNLAPSGDWNLYRLDGYRLGLRPEPAYPHLPVQLQRQEGRLILDLELDLGPIAAPETALAVAVCAVLEEREGAISYWALAHPGADPDFHRRDGFLIQLPGRSL